MNRIALDPRLVAPQAALDLRYATPENFLGRAVYPAATARLRTAAAEAVIRVHRGLAADGLGLHVYDAYRPLSVTRLMWDAAADVPGLEPREAFLAPPHRGSDHNRGIAVDCTLFDRRSGAVLPMPTPFDAFTPDAAAAAEAGTLAERRNRDRLIAVMAAERFRVLDSEWWHFAYIPLAGAPVLDVPIGGERSGRVEAGAARASKIRPSARPRPAPGPDTRRGP